MEPMTADEGLELPRTLGTPFVTRCDCGRNWHMSMKRGEAGQHGCVRCSCDAELISWSGTVVFDASPADID